MLPPTPPPADAPTDDWISARDAAAQLGVTLPTLYSYVSRGLLHPVAQANSHAKRYRRAEVQRLALRHASARAPQRVAGAALDHGLPVLASGLSRIADGRLWYRGDDAVTLAETASLEQVAARLWGVDTVGHPAPVRRPRGTAATAGTAVTAGVAAPPGSAGAPEALTLTPMAAWRAFHRIAAVQPEAADTGDLTDCADQAWHWVEVMARATAGCAPARGRRGTAHGDRSNTPGPAAAPIHERLAAAWRLPAPAADALRHALVLCADHELNASSFTARCVASTGATLAASVGAALGALTGPRHGGITARIEAWWPQLEALPRDSRALRRAVATLLATQPPPGFGHPLYPEGDPRCRALLQRLRQAGSGDRRCDRFVDAMDALGGHAPVIDFGLVALRRALGAPPGAAFAIFAIGRTVGWIAHALEQRASGELIRPRAAFVAAGPR